MEIQRSPFLCGWVSLSKAYRSGRYGFLASPDIHTRETGSGHWLLTLALELAPGVNARSPTKTGTDAQDAVNYAL